MSYVEWVTAIAAIGTTITSIVSIYRWVYCPYKEHKTHRIILDIIKQEELSENLKNVRWKLRGHMNSILQRHEFSGGWGLGIVFPAHEQLKDLVEKSIIEQLSDYEKLSELNNKLLGIAKKMARLTFQDIINSNFKASEKAFEEKLGSLWNQFEQYKICEKMMWRELEISKSLMEDKFSGLYQLIMKSKVENEDISNFLSNLNEAFKNEDAFIMLRSNVDKQAKFGEDILNKINEEEKKIQLKIDDLKTKVNPRELDEFRKKETPPKTSDEPQVRWG